MATIDVVGGEIRVVHASSVAIAPFVPGCTEGACFMFRKPVCATPPRELGEGRHGPVLVLELLAEAYRYRAACGAGTLHQRITGQPDNVLVRIRYGREETWIMPYI